MRKIHTTLTKNFITSRLQGRTGNIMFQIANGYIKALEYNRQFVAPFEESPTGHLEKNLLRKIDFHIPRTSGILNSVTINPPFTYTHFTPSDDKPTVFSGWFQSEKFFGKYTEVVKDLFSPPIEFINKATTDFPFLTDSTVAVINVRRGDYLTQPRRHPVVTLDYINEAYKHLPKHDVLLIVSDDIEWCKQNLNFPNIIFNEKYWDQDALWLLSLCDHFIISNSTFSWWGAWLSRSDNKVIISPSTWFGPDVVEDPRDIWCDSWIKIPTRWEDGFIKLQLS
jgi:hypothetical protein